MITSDRRLLGGVTVIFIVVAALAAIDLATDLREDTPLTHVLVEGGMLVAGLMGATVVARRLAAAIRATRQAAAQVEALAAQLAVRTAEAERWRAEVGELMAGLGAAIDTQFERWQLSPAEKETGLLLLKGLAHKEIAGVRSVTEATARQQARAVYRKAGLSGRNDLSAFFLEDLMLPASKGGADVARTSDKP